MLQQLLYLLLNFEDLFEYLCSSFYKLLDDAYFLVLWDRDFSHLVGIL